MTMKKILVSLFVLPLLFSSQNVSAQREIGNFLQEDIAASKALISEYISPFMKSVSLGLNQGWYNTAKPHKFFGVDVTTSVSFMRIPDSDTRFNVEGLGTNFGLQPDSPGYPNAPTIFGSSDTPVYTYTNDGSTYSFDGPGGIGMKDEIGYNLVPVPMANIGFSLPTGTDIKVRFVPTIDLNNKGEFKMWGLGVMHDVKQYIPGIKLLPFDLSAFAGYTRMSVMYDMEDDRVAGENQHAVLRMNALTIQGVISKKISILTLYGGLGYNVGQSNLGIKGTYDINDDGDTSDQHERDPADLKFSASGPRATAGFRVKLAVITLHADYSFQKYNALTIGFGVSVR
jgi:hypothetical protein